MEGWRGRHRDSPPYVVPTAASALAGRCLKGERRPWRREPAAAAARSLTQSSLLRTQDRLSDKYTERVGGGAGGLPPALPGEFGRERLFLSVSLSVKRPYRRRARMVESTAPGAQRGALPQALPCNDVEAGAVLWRQVLAHSLQGALTLLRTDGHLLIDHRQRLPLCVPTRSRVQSRVQSSVVIYTTGYSV